MIDWKHERVLVTGGYGFLGQHVMHELTQRGVHAYRAHSAQHNLIRREAIRDLLHAANPTVVLHLAAVVGGIGANRQRPAEFFYQNAMMGLQLLHESYVYGVKKFVATGTICAYPKHTPVPFQEADLWNGYPEETNAPYGIAKKLLSVQSAAYRQQYGFRSAVVYPVNLYGPGDNFDLQTSHVIPAMIRKFDTAKREGAPSVRLWGDGSPTREFLYVEDCARALLRVVEDYDSSEPLNLGTGQEISIRQLSETIQHLVGYTGEVIWDTEQPNGQPRRCVSTQRAKELLGFAASTSLEEGLERTLVWWWQRTIK